MATPEAAVLQRSMANSKAVLMELLRFGREQPGKPFDAQLLAKADACMREMDQKSFGAGGGSATTAVTLLRDEVERSIKASHLEVQNAMAVVETKSVALETIRRGLAEEEARLRQKAVQRKQELESVTDQLARAAASMHSASPLSPEYEKALERHSQLYPSVKQARDEHATAEAALEEFLRQSYDGDQRTATEDLEKARAALRAAQATNAHKQGVLPLARAVQAELSVQGSGWALAESGLQEQQSTQMIQQQQQQAAIMQHQMLDASRMAHPISAPPGGLMAPMGANFAGANQMDWRQQMALNQAKEAVQQAAFEAAGGAETHLKDAPAIDQSKRSMFSRACESLGF